MIGLEEIWVIVDNRGCQHYTLVHQPARRIIATLRSAGQAKALAAELAPLYARDDQGKAALVVVDRHISEQA